MQRNFCFAIDTVFGYLTPEMKTAIYIVSPEGEAYFVNPANVPQGYGGSLCDIPAEQPFDTLPL